MKSLIYLAQTVNIPGIPKTNTGNAIESILGIVFIVTGAVAVLFIIIGAVQYAISAGNQSQITKAKDTILYALVGLVISISAFAIVQFTIGSVSTP